MPVDHTLPYDDTNVFARILRGELPARRVYEDAYALAFHDRVPQAPVHVLIIPKGPYVSWDDFARCAPDALIAGFTRAIQHTADALGIGADGYRLLSNAGPHSHQEVPHLHVHLFAGRPLGPLLAGTMAV